MAASFSDTLLAWYDTHHRDLPWRAPPGAPPPDPYRVWLSEIMLQQTTVAAVKPYFEAFTARWPTIEALAAAPEEDVMAAWAGLGYYSRARNLVKTARLVAECGGFPQEERALRDLPGLGAYTAAAIAAIAFEQRAVVVDANVERVVSRLFAIAEVLPAARKTIRAKTDTITPDRREGDFAQAMMDLGSTICTVRAPKCLLCPVGTFCVARQQSDPERFPVKPPKKDKPVRFGAAFWMTRGDTVWLVKRPAKGVFAGMRALPSDGWSAQQDGDGEAPFEADWAEVGCVSHGFTHFTLELSVRRAQTAAQPGGEGEWWPIDRIDQAGLPTLFAKAARLVRAAYD